ncbi:AP2-containing protein [Hordeum vulgare]|nr:AP2-containing protein [Hordeum vulgare]
MIATRADAEFLMPESIQMKEIMTKKMKKRPTIVVDPIDSDEAAMSMFAWEHPKYVQVEQKYLWKREAEHKKKKEDEAGPSTIIPVESSKEDDKEFCGGARRRTTTTTGCPQMRASLMDVVG